MRVEKIENIGIGNPCFVHIFSNSVLGRSPTGGHKPSGNAPRLFGPGDGRLRGNREDAVIRLSAQCPAAKLLDQLP